MAVRKFALVATIIAGSCILGAACSQGEKEESSDDGFAIEYEKYTLDNGLDVILHVDKSDPVVAVASLFHVGSNREVPGRTGFAHFFEHMSFNDSENVPRGANRKYIEELGGSRNGGTSFDYTQYYEVVPSDAMEKIFWIDSDRMGYMINTVTVEALEREKQVVKNEKRQRTDNVPYGFTFPVILEALFPDGHPYSWPVIGSLEDLQNATLDDVKEFYQRWYGANNATLAVAGDFDPEMVKPLIEQWFGEMRRGPEALDMKPMPAELEASRNLWYPDNFAKLPALTRVYPAVEQYHPDSYALDVLSRVLAGSKNAPLYKVVVEERKVAPAASANNAAFELAGMFMVSIRAMEGTKLDDVEAALEEGLTRFAKDGFADSELTRIKAELESEFYQDFSSVLNKAQGLASYNEFTGNPGFATENLQRILAVTREDVVRVFQKYVQDKHFVQTSFVPKTAPELAVAGAELAQVSVEKVVQGAEAEVSQGAMAEYEKTPSDYDRSEPPLGSLPLVRLPEVWTRTLANGVEVTGIEDRELPLIAFQLMIPGGQWMDAPERLGAASLLAALSNQGTANRTPAELEEAMGLLGAQISFSASAEAYGISAVTLERNLDATIALVEEMLLEPRWDDAEFARLKSATEADIIAAEGSARAVAGLVYRKMLYGASHPFGRQSRGTRETIGAMTIEDLKDWHAEHVVASGARLQVVGAATGDRIETAFAQLAERWTGDAPATPQYDVEPAGEAGTVYFIDMPGAKQSVIIAGKRAVPVTDPEWAKIDFANKRLGGGSSARLMQLLRIEKGYTYGAGSWISDNINDASAWLASTSVRANVTLESMQLIREQIAAYSETFTDADASVTKNQVIKSNARAFETLDAKLNLLNRIAQQGLPHDTVERETAVLEGMDTADFQQVIEDHMSESEMTWVIVGDAETQLQRIRDSEFGEVVVLDRQGNE